MKKMLAFLLIVLLVGCVGESKADEARKLVEMNELRNEIIALDNEVNMELFGEGYSEAFLNVTERAGRYIVYYSKVRGNESSAVIGYVVDLDKKEIIEVEIRSAAVQRTASLVYEHDGACSLLAGMKNDTTYCDRMIDTTSKQTCHILHDVLKIEKDVTVKDVEKCNKLPGEMERKVCYMGINARLLVAILAKGNEYTAEEFIPICEAILTQPAADNCYFAVSMRIIDRSVCNKITNETLREACIESVELRESLERLQNMTG